MLKILTILLVTTSCSFNTNHLLDKCFVNENDPGITINVTSIRTNKNKEIYINYAVAYSYDNGYENESNFTRIEESFNRRYKKEIDCTEYKINKVIAINNDRFNYIYKKIKQPKYKKEK